MKLSVESGNFSCSCCVVGGFALVFFSVLFGFCKIYAVKLLHKLMLFKFFMEVILIRGQLHSYIIANRQTTGVDGAQG